MKDRGKIVILGAGPTGLGAAYRLLQLGYTEFCVIERESGPGGLAASIVDEQGFTWDLGGHVQFSHYRYYDEVLDRAVGRWLFHERESWIWIHDRFIPYPFQYNIRHLDLNHQHAILTDLRRIASQATPRAAGNFHDWILQTFGQALADIFLLPYNFKVWGYPLDRLGVGWMGERVAVPDVDRIERNIEEGQDDVSWGPNNTFRFPERGGTGAIWSGVRQLIPERYFHFTRKVDEVDLNARLVRAGGQQFDYETLISTLPLDLFCSLADGLNVAAHADAQNLVHSSVHIVGVGLRGAVPDVLRKKCWIYFPENHSPYYRVTVFSNYSPNNVPDAALHWSLMAEVCETSAKPVDTSQLCARTVAAMKQDGLINRSEIVSVWHHRLEYGYPTPFIGRDEVLGRLNAELESRSVFSRGRFGAWKYEVSNQDHSFMQGVEIANRLILGETEVTFQDPAMANSGRFLQKV